MRRTRSRSRSYHGDIDACTTLVGVPVVPLGPRLHVFVVRSRSMVWCAVGKGGSFVTPSCPTHPTMRLRVSSRANTPFRDVGFTPVVTTGCQAAHVRLTSGQIQSSVLSTSCQR